MFMKVVHSCKPFNLYLATHYICNLPLIESGCRCCTANAAASYHAEFPHNESTKQQILWLVDRETSAPDENENDSEEEFEDEDKIGVGEGLINDGKHDQSEGGGSKASPQVDVGVDPIESISMGSDGEL